MPIATLLRPRPTAQWSASWSAITERIDSSSKETFRITAEARQGRIVASFGSMVNFMPEGLTVYFGRPVSIPRNPRIARAAPSTEKRSGRFGKNSTSTWSSSIRSISEPIMGRRFRIVSLSVPVSRSRYL